MQGDWPWVIAVILVVAMISSSIVVGVVLTGDVSVLERSGNRATTIRYRGAIYRCITPPWREMTIESDTSGNAR